MIPIYVTRKTADGQTGSIALTPYLFGTVMVLGVLNLVGWMAYAFAYLVYLTVTAVS